MELSHAGGDGREAIGTCDEDFSVVNEIKLQRKRTYMAMSETNPRLKSGRGAVEEDGEKLMSTTEEESSEKIKELRARLAAALDAAKDAAQRLEEKTIAAAKATDRCIREHPYQTIGVAFGLGLLVGVLATRRRD